MLLSLLRILQNTPFIRRALIEDDVRPPLSPSPPQAEIFGDIYPFLSPKLIILEVYIALKMKENEARG